MGSACLWRSSLGLDAVVGTDGWGSARASRPSRCIDTFGYRRARIRPRCLAHASPARTLTASSLQENVPARRIAGWPDGDEQDAPSGLVRVRRASSSRSRVRLPAIASTSARSSPRAGRCSAFAALGGVLLALVLARETSLFAVQAIEVAGGARWSSDRCARRSTHTKGKPLRPRPRRARTDVTALPTVAAVSFDRAYPHASRHDCPRTPGGGRAPGRRRVRRLRARPRDRAGRAGGQARPRADLGRPKDVAASPRRIRRRRSRHGRRRRRSAGGHPVPSRVVSVTTAEG